LDGETTLTNCTSQTWDPGAVGSTTVATVDVAMPSGYATGDLLVAGMNASTSYLAWNVVASGTGYATVILWQPDGDYATNIDLGSRTLKTCYFD
jgi:hypothetical protein